MFPVGVRKGLKNPRMWGPDDGITVAVTQHGNNISNPEATKNTHGHLKVNVGD